jgi:hypothetical protein
VWNTKEEVIITESDGLKDVNSILINIWDENTTTRDVYLGKVVISINAFKEIFDDDGVTSEYKVIF